METDEERFVELIEEIRLFCFGNADQSEYIQLQERLNEIGELFLKYRPIDEVLSVHKFVEDIIEPKDCNKCIHISVCKMLDYMYKDNFKLSLLLSHFFEIYTDSNLADKCVKYKEEVTK